MQNRKIMRKVYCISQKEVLASYSQKDSIWTTLLPVIILIITLIFIFIGYFFWGLAVSAFLLATTNDKVFLFGSSERTKEGEYVVGKSFPNVRDKSLQLKKKQKNNQHWAIFGIVCMAITFFQHRTQGHLDQIIPFALLLLVAYAIAKYKELAIDLHGDIAFETCENLESIINMEVDETFEASCQSFNGHQRNSVVGDYLFVLTSRSIYYALRKKGGWTSFRKPLSQILKLGYAYGRDGTDEYICWKFEFSEGATLFVKLEQLEGLSYPELMSKKLLEVFDSHLSNESESQSTKRRRRVNTMPNSPTSNETVTQTSVAAQEQPATQKKVRLEIDDTLMSELQDAVPYEFSRTLEL